jgi:L-arabinokinase
VTEVDVGPGVVQKGPLESDLDATETALARHMEHFSELAAEEAGALRELGVRGVYADVPPVAFEAAARAGVPSVGLANFTWSWIYAGFPRCERFAPRIAEAEARATLFLELPFSGGTEHFPRREELPLVVRHPTRSRGDARALLPLRAGEGRPVVLLSFGGFGDALDLGFAARRNEGFVFVAFAASRESAENLLVLPHDHAFPHQDLVLAADAILGKPGYGTVAESILARRPFVVAPRGDFREAPVLEQGIRECLPSAALTAEELFEGRWTAALEKALSAPVPDQAIGFDGAEVAARRIEDLVA